MREQSAITPLLWVWVGGWGVVEGGRTGGGALDLPQLVLPAARLTRVGGGHVETTPCPLLLLLLSAALGGPDFDGFDGVC